MTVFFIKVSNIPVKFMLRGLKPIMLIVIFTAVLNLFLTPGETVLFSNYRSYHKQKQKHFHPRIRC